MPPTSCAARYPSTSFQAKRPATASPRVTAGLKWPPETGPNEYAPTSTLRPSARATPRNPTLRLPSPASKPAAKIAVPITPKTRMNVPRASAVSFCTVDGAVIAGAAMPVRRSRVPFRTWRFLS